jgi:formamidopyrimidine-DNA glycosylase
LRFGMSGRLIVDGVAAVDNLVYASNAEDTRFDRFGITLGGKRGGALVMRDPRRLGGVEVQPDETRLGPDALSLTAKQLRHALAGSAAPLKARLMDQAKLAGIGNLTADEVLWRAGLDPARPAGSLDDRDITRLAATVRRTLRVMLERGGSHTGDLMVARVRGGRCPRDGEPLIRRTIGGRTTFSCPAHQR